MSERGAAWWTYVWGLALLVGLMLVLVQSW